MLPRFVPPHFATIAAIFVIAFSIVGAVALAAKPSLWPAHSMANSGFDPVLAPNTVCITARGGAPPAAK